MARVMYGISLPRVNGISSKINNGAKRLALTYHQYLYYRFGGLSKLYLEKLASL